MYALLPKKLLSNTLRKYMHNLSIYFFSNALAKIIPFILLPFITAALPVEEYGRWGLFLSVLFFIQPFIGLSLVQFWAKSYVVPPQCGLPKLLTSFLFINFFASIIVGIGLYLFNIFYPSFLQFTPLLCLSVAILSLMVVIRTYLQTIYVLKRAPVQYSIINFLNIAGIPTLALLMIYTKGYSWEAFIVATLIIEALIILYSIFFFAKENLFHQSLNFQGIPFKSVALVCSPLILHSLAGAFISFSDRIILNKYIGIESVGIYSVGYALGLAIYMIVHSFNNIWDPWILEQLKNITYIKKCRIVKYIYIYTAFLLIVCCGITICGGIYIDLFLPQEYVLAKSVVGLIALGCVFQGIYFCLFNIFVYIEKTSILPIATCISGSVNVALALYLIPILGLLGAALAVATSFLSLLIISLLFLRKLYPLPWLFFLK